jgi:phage-related protein (TIGR01555 family)
MASSRKSQMADGLANAVTGLGTNRDPRTAAAYLPGRNLTQQEIHAAYCGSGLIRKIVSIPAFDAIREWRDWRADQEQIKALEAEEKRLDLRAKVLMAETARAMGGGALILGLPGDPSQAAPANIGKGKLAFVNVVSRWHLQFTELSDDPTAPGFGEPLMWSMSTRSGRMIKIHPSRVVAFRGDGVAALVDPGIASLDDAFWGVSEVQHVLDAVKDSDTARQSFAALLDKAKRLRIGIPDLMELVDSEKGEATLMKRLAILAQAEGILNATIYDAGDSQEGKGGEKIDDVQYNFAGAKDMLNAFSDFVAAVSDIPATRLLGRAPEGLNSSGDGQQKDWNKKVRAKQTLFVGPRLDVIDSFLIPSALGSRPPEIWSEFAPLEAPDEDKEATRFKTVAEALDAIRSLNAIPEVAFNKAAQNTIVEGGYMPGLEQALAEIPEDERYGLVSDPAAADPEKKGGDQGLSAGTGGERKRPRLAAPRRMHFSAMPRPARSMSSASF